MAAESAALAADQVLVVCPSCDARYRIDADTVARPKVKFKCTQCGHLFPMAAAAGLGAAVPPVAAPAPGPQAPVHVVGAKDMPL
nr:hypothetical protein [Gammaproteobacteria bacterium]